MVHHARHDYIELSYVYVGALLLVVFLSLVAMPVNSSRFGVIVPKTSTQEVDLYTSTAFDGVQVRAEAYVVYDLVDKKVVAAKNAEKRLPLASLTKVMTGMTALIHHDKKTQIMVDSKSIEGSYDLGLKKGQVWKLDELLKYTLVFSSNDGAYIIADSFGGRKKFVEQMNLDSTLLGLGLTFTDPAGLDIGESIGGYGTALDIAKLFAAARKKYPEVFDATTKVRATATASTGKVSGIPNTNQDIENLFGAEASKTGFTDSAGGNLGVIVDVTLGHPTAIVVLGSTKEERFTDMETLYKALLASVK